MYAIVTYNRIQTIELFISTVVFLFSFIFIAKFITKGSVSKNLGKSVLKKNKVHFSRYKAIVSRAISSWVSTELAQLQVSAARSRAHEAYRDDWAVGYL